MSRASRSSSIPSIVLGVFDQWAPWILAALATAVPLAFNFSFYDTFDLPKMLLVYVAVLVLLSLWIWQQSSVGWSITPTGIIFPLLLFIVLALGSCWTSIDLSRSLFGSYRTYVYGWIPMAALALLFFLTTQIHSEKVTGQVMMAALLGGAIAALYGLLQYTGNEIFELMPKIAYGRVWSSLGNPIYFGAIVMMALPLGLNLRRGGMIASLFLILPGLAISLSRSAWMGSFAAMAYLLFVFRHNLRISAAKIGGAALLLLLLGLLFPASRQRLSVMTSARESSNAGRIEGWKGGIRVWRHHPLLGSGPDTFFDAFRPYRNKAFIESAGKEVSQAHAHNEIIQVAATLGSCGLIAWMWMIVAYARRLHIVWTEDPVSMSGSRPFLVASLIAIFVQNMFNPSSPASAAWTVIFAGLAIRQSAARDLPSRPWPLWSRVGIVGVLLSAGMWGISIPTRAEQFYKEGIVLEAHGNLVNALSSYEHAVRLRPDIEAYQMSLGNAARSLAQLSPEGAQRQVFWREAMKAAQDSVERHPANPDAWNDLGVADMWLTQLAGASRMPEAKIAFEKAITLDPVYIDAWANLAKWYHIAGQLETEKQMWKMVLQFDPQHEMALQVLGKSPQGIR